MAARVPQPPDDDQVRRFGSRLFSRFAWDNNVYCVPVDETERDRASEFDALLQEHLFNSTVLIQGFSGQVNEDNEPVVLDCGCGSGAWITRFLDERDGDGDVTGIDIFFGQPSTDDDDDEPEEEEEDDEDGEDDEAVQEFEKIRWNLNARFRDAPREYGLLRDRFDLINSRMLAEGIHTNRWRDYIGQLRLMLKHGGGLQVVELQLHIQSWNGRLAEDSCLTEWWNLYRRAGDRMNRNPRVGLELGRLLTEAEFVNVRYWAQNVPIGPWMVGYEELGREMVPLVLTMLQSLSLVPFIRVLQIGENRYRTLIHGVREELSRAGENKLYFKV